jgi:dTDP-glucose 4,6-dehydratase
MKLLISGGMGFVGSHCVEGVLKNTDWDIVVLDRLDLSGNPNRLEDMDIWEKEKQRVKFVWWDLKSNLNEQVKQSIGEVDYIWHLAASSHVDRSITDPMSFIMDNVVGTTNLLLFAKELKDLKLFVNFSTDEVFGAVKDGFSKEFDHHHPKNPYAASKSGQEAIAEAFENCYKLPIITTHTMNIAGCRQHPEKFIPMVMRKVLLSEKVSIHSNPEKTKAAIRSYIHARNVCSALLFLTKRGFQGYDEFNIVGEKEVDALNLAKMIAGFIGKDLIYEMVDFHSSRPGHDLRYALDGSKLKELGFELPKKLEEWLKHIVEWSIRPENLKWIGM